MCSGVFNAPRDTVCYMTTEAHDGAIILYIVIIINFLLYTGLGMFALLVIVGVVCVERT